MSTKSLEFICSKCGYADAYVRYNGDTSTFDSSKDYLVCKCLRCGYIWKEEPLDKRGDK